MVTLYTSDVTCYTVTLRVHECNRPWDFEHNVHITQPDGFKITRGVGLPQLLGCVRHLDWLNIVQTMTLLAQFCQQL